MEMLLFVAFISGIGMIALVVGLMVYAASGSIALAIIVGIVVVLVLSAILVGAL